MSIGGFLGKRTIMAITASLAALERDGQAREVDSGYMQTVLAFITVDICLVTVMLASSRPQLILHSSLVHSHWSRQREIKIFRVYCFDLN